MKKNKFQLKKEATHQALIEAGLALFFEKGYGLTSVDDIVRQSGSSKGGFYFHFKSKEDFFLQIIEYRVAQRGEWNSVPYRYAPAETSLEEVLRKAFYELEATSQAMKGWIMILIDFFLHTRHNPEIRAMFKQYYERWVSEIATFVDALKAQGFIAPDKDSRLAAEHIYKLTEGFMMHYAMYEATDMNVLETGYLAILKR